MERVNETWETLYFAEIKNENSLRIVVPTDTAGGIAVMIRPNFLLSQAITESAQHHRDLACLNRLRKRRVQEIGVMV